MKKAIKIFDIILAGLMAVIFSVIAWANAFMPANIVTYDNEDMPHGRYFSFGRYSGSKTVDSQNSTPTMEELKLFGIFPVKTVAHTQKSSPKVMVSGEVFGIKLYTDGVIVVGTQSVETDDGMINPAKNAGIEVGDVIISVNNTNVYTSDTVEKILNDNNGEPYKLRIKRDGEYKNFTLVPAYCTREGSFKAGMWVRDSTAGIGTLTFYNKNSGTFGALGHQINDVDTNEIMPLLDGEAVSATVTGVEKPYGTMTGSLECNFLDNTIGKIVKNTPWGIYGSYTSVGDAAKEYQVASPGEITKGEATLISTVEKGAPKKYKILISRISYNERNKEKNMIIKIDDEDLISKTGGIVQGMSGSPIIQNGKLVGALTHVIVDNPKKGYAVFAQTMVEESQSLP